MKNSRKGYNRRYYLHKKIRKAGYRLTITKTVKMVSVTVDQVAAALQDKYLAELRNVHSYAVHYLNPMITI